MRICDGSLSSRAISEMPWTFCRIERGQQFVRRAMLETSRAKPNPDFPEDGAVAQGRWIGS